MILREPLKRCLPLGAIRALRDLRMASGGLRLLIHRFRTACGMQGAPIDDNTWFELQFKPQEALNHYGIPLPGLPSDEVQMRYTARAGRNNLQQAFSFYKFYKHVRSACKLSHIKEPRILDFGGGWGRISRFFLRDTKPEFIYITDCLGDAIDRLHATGNPCKILKNEPLPPIVGLDTYFDLIYAFSVFSHLSEQFLRAWLTYLMGCLRPGGHLVFTTRGRQFIDQLEQVHREAFSIHSYLREKLPPPQEVRERYLKGEFQFYPTGEGDELTSDFYGEALIPPRYIETNYRSALVDFTEEVPDVDQSVVVLKKTQDEQFAPAGVPTCSAELGR